MDEFLEEEKLLSQGLSVHAHFTRRRNPIMFDQNLSSLSPSFHRWVINVKFVATPGRSFDGGTFPRQIGLPPVQSGQSVVMERQRRCSGQNLESLITDPPPPQNIRPWYSPHCTVRTLLVEKTTLQFVSQCLQHIRSSLYFQCSVFVAVSGSSISG